jgi:hypothetical protein
VSVDGYWWLSLGLGFVAILVAVALLQAFLVQVLRIERDAEAVWEAGKRVARNTVTTWMLGKTTERLALLAEEAKRHEGLLRAGRRTAGRR